MSDHNDLRQKIDEAKSQLPLPELMSREGLREHAKKTAHCPFHDDERKSFSVFQGNDGWWHYKCFAGCGEGDEIKFLSKLKRRRGTPTRRGGCRVPAAVVGRQDGRARDGRRALAARRALVAIVRTPPHASARRSSLRTKRNKQRTYALTA